METRKERYSEEFKREAIKLADEIGAREASEKLGIGSPQAIGSWRRFLVPKEEEVRLDDLASALKEIKKLKRELVSEKKNVAILKDAMAFFSKEILK